MATIAENIQTIANNINSIKTNLELDSSASLSDVVTKSSTAKFPTGTVNITENGAVDVTNYASANVNVSGGGGLEIKDVNFFDYDGTLLYSYTLAEIMDMTELPAGPTHEGLVFQEWNWTLADIKTNNGPLDAGATYTTASGATEFDIIVNSFIGMTITFSNFTGVTSIDWGDGTTDSNLSHTYEEKGNYTIKVYGLSKISGTFLPSSGNIKNCIKNVRLCNVTQLGSSSMGSGSVAKLENITISNKVTTVSTNNFKNLYNLKYIVFPKGITSFASRTPENCYSLKGVSVPKSITTSTLGNGTHCIKRIAIPKSYTRIPSYFLLDTYNLKYIKMPTTIASIAGTYSFSASTDIIIDFRDFTAIPSLDTTSGFISFSDVKILVPDALYDDWIAATNWSNVAYAIYKASEVELW